MNVKAILNNELKIDILLDENPTLSKTSENIFVIRELWITLIIENHIIKRFTSNKNIDCYLYEIREELNENQTIVQSFKFKRNQNFDRSDEASTKWIDISSKDNENLKLEIRRDGDIDWNKLMEQCDSGLLYENENIQTAQLKAFTIDITKIKPNLYLQPPSENLKFKWSKDLTTNPLKKLGEITKEYGYFYASEIIFGGAIIEKNNYRQEKGVNHVNVNCEVQNEIEESTTKILDISKLTTIGGKVTLYSKKDSQKWKDSVDDSKYWRIISYKIQPIFDLLDDELRNKVLESFGKQIFK
ncbi:25142_t:CDS:2, partial [Gigaspora rosea]